jgi:signal transduction histidine kinase
VLCSFFKTGAQQKVTDSLQNLIRMATTDTQRINLQLKLANILKGSAPEEARTLVKTTLEASRQHDYKKGEGFCYNTLGVLYDYQGNYDSALLCYQQALALFNANDIEEGKAAALLSIGNYNYYQASYIQAADYMLQSLRLYEKIQDENGQASALNNLASVYNDKKDYRTALTYYFRSLSLKKKLNAGRALASTLVNIGNAYDGLKMTDSAFYWYQESLNNALQFENKRSIAIARSNIGNIYFEKQQYDKALTEYEAALAIDRERGDQEGIGANLINAGHAYVKLRNYNKAVTLLHEGLAIVKEIHQRLHIQNALKFLAEASAGAGNHANAYQYLLEYTAVHDSVYTSESNQQIAEMRTLYETEKKDAAIQILSKEKQVQQRTILFMIVLALLALILGAVIWSRYIIKQRANKLLAEKNQELVRLNATKDKLFAIVAHDLKNPLSAFRSITQNLSENSLHISKEEIEHFIGRLNQSANQLYDLLQNLLNWAISQIGKLPFAPEKISLQEMAEENIRLFTANLEEKKQSVRTDIDTNLYALADRNMIRTVIRNLLSNAVKFTGREGAISFSAARQNNEVVFTVADSGTGMQPADLEKLFKIEEDVTTIGQSPEKGTGIGLILCKELVEKNKGRIWAESQPGQGSRFHFALPAVDI